MIRAKHSAWADKIFHLYVMRLFKRHFHKISVLGEIPETDPALPLLLLPNHSTWWDGFFVYLLNKRLFARAAYLMMLEEQLSRYGFFSRLGAFSVDPRSPRHIREALQYAVTVIKSPSPPKPLLCLLPQGELVPWEKRPLGYKRGMEVLLKMYGEKVNLLPLAIKIEFLMEQLPEVFFLFGDNCIADADTFMGIRKLEQIETELLEALSAKITNGEAGIVLVTGRRSVNIRLDKLRKIFEK